MSRTRGKSDEYFERLVLCLLINPIEEETDDAVGFVRERVGRAPVETFKEDVPDRRYEPPSSWQVAQQLMRERRPLHPLRKLEHQGCRDARLLKLGPPLIQLKWAAERSVSVKTQPD